MATDIAAGIVYYWDHVQQLFCASGYSSISGGAGSSTNVIPESVAGSLPVGSANYTLPSANAIYVSPSGLDTNAGTIGAPVKTFEKAVALVPSGGTIVMRAGTYHEGRVFSSTASSTASAYMAINVNKSVTIQNYPNEEVWFDGSTVLNNASFTADSGYWSMPWVALRRDPTYSWYTGTYPPTNWIDLDPNANVPYWNFVNPNYPTAGWPERVWIDNVLQTQVDALNKIGAGKIFIDGRTNKLYLPISPSGKTIRITDLQTLMNFTAANCTLRGIGVRRYANSQPQQGCVKIQKVSGCVVENCVFEDIAAMGIYVVGDNSAAEYTSNATISNVTLNRIGNLGICAYKSEHLTLKRLRVTEGNFSHYNYAPAAGGLKFSKSRYVVLSESVFRDNYANGAWFDEDCHDITVHTTDFTHNEYGDVDFELCGSAYVYNCRFKDSGAHSIALVNNERFEGWNNTFVGAGRLKGYVNIIKYNADDRAPRPDSGVSWVWSDRVPATWPGQQPSTTLGYVPRKCMFRNSVFGFPTPVNGSATGPRAWFSDEDFRSASSAAETWITSGVDINGSTYNYDSGATDMLYGWILQTTATGSFYTTKDYASWKSWTASQGHPQDANSYYVESNRTNILDSNDQVVSTHYETAASAARPLPSVVATLLGVPANIQHPGCWR